MHLFMKFILAPVLFVLSVFVIIQTYRKYKIKRLLKKYKYPPDDVPEALQTVMSQCELWADNIMDVRKKSYLNDSSGDEGTLRVAEDPEQYGVNS